MAGEMALHRFVLRRPVLIGAVALLIIMPMIAWHGLRSWNSYQRDGEVRLARYAPEAPVEITRDAHGVPYVLAATMRDALWGQGYALAQDRPFQLEVRRRAARGELAFVIGEDGLASDIRMRTLGFRRLAEARLQALAEDERRYLEAFVAGINAYVSAHDGATAAEFDILNLFRSGAASEITAGIWTPTDILTLFYTMSYYFARDNPKLELTMQGLLERLPAQTVSQLTPFMPNPDDPERYQREAGVAIPQAIAAGFEPLDFDVSRVLFEPRGDARPVPGEGSNSWAISGERSTTGKAILVNDPHLDIRRLPGPWHPIGLITPERSIVGANIGMPGIFTGKSGPVALGVTIGYADDIDLYVEQLDPSDPNIYGDTSGGTATWLPFEVEQHEISVADDAVPEGVRIVPLTVRRTRSGRPVVLEGDALGVPHRAITLRWTAAEPEALADPKLGIIDLLHMDDVEDGLAAASELDLASLNLTFADEAGRVARRASGLVPRRAMPGIAPKPSAMAASDWSGFRSPAEMPGELDPERGWSGSANHMVARGPDAATYATAIGASYRYRRMQELFDGEAPISPATAWGATDDLVNLFARQVSPIIADALKTNTRTAQLGQMLAEWDHRDTADAPAPLIFQAIIVELADIAFGRLVEDDLRTRLLKDWKVWHERLFTGIVRPDSTPLFANDDDRDELVIQAAIRAMTKLERQYGADPRDWRWGDAHRLQLVAPLCSPGESCLFGGHDIALPGSGETLLRGQYDYKLDGEERFNPWSVVSMRLMVDFAEPDRIRYTLPGGVVGRTFHEHLDNGVDHHFGSEPARFMYTTRAQIERHGVHRLILIPVTD